MATVKQEVDISLLRRFSPLDELAHDKLSELTAKATVVEVGRGEAVAAKAGRNSSVFLVSGAVDRAPGSPGAEVIKAKTDRARRAILSPSDRVRVVAKTDAVVLCVDNALLEFLASWGSSTGGAYTGIVVDEIEASSGDWVDGLMRSDVVANLSPASIQALMSAIEPAEVGADEIIFRQGDAPDFYYIVSSGRCVVTRRDPVLDTSVDLATIGPGGAFGEEALITNAPRNATVRMIEKGTVLRLRESEFKRMLETPLVKTLENEQLSTLKSGGAIVLYIAGGEGGAPSQEGATISLARLREQMPALKKGRKYIVLSGDDKLSTAAAFLLAQKRFDVCVLKNADAEKQTASTSASSSRPVAVLEDAAAKLEQEVEELRRRLAEEQQNHAAAVDRVRTLEADLQSTRAGAKAAITAAGDRRTRSEAQWRQQMTDLSKALKQEQDGRAALAGEHARLSQQIERAQLDLAHSKEDSNRLAHDGEKRLSELGKTVAELQRARETEARAAETLRAEYQALETRHSELEDASRQLLEENQTLSGQYTELEGRFQQLDENCGHLAQEKASVEKQYAELHGRFTQLDAENKAMQDAYAALQSASQEMADEVESLKRRYAEETQQLRAQLGESNQKLRQQAERAAQLQGELAQSTAQAEERGQSLASLQQRHADLEAQHERSQQENVELEKARTDLYMQVMTLTNEGIEKAKVATAQRKALEQDIESLKTSLESSKEAFQATEADLQRKAKKLHAELGQANQKVSHLTTRSSKQESDIRLLNAEADALRASKKRRGTVIGGLSILLLATSAATAAGLLGVDLRAHANELMAQLTTLLNGVR